MGYRSNVICLMYSASRDDNDSTKGIIKEFIRQRVTPELFQYFNFDGWGARFEAEDWKWYDGYADIDSLMKLFDEYAETFCEGGYESKYAFEYVRIGESYDDVEMIERGGYQNRLYVSRLITVDEN